jgi:hypothetical protein
MNDRYLPPVLAVPHQDAASRGDVRLGISELEVVPTHALQGTEIGT